MSADRTPGASPYNDAFGEQDAGGGLDLAALWDYATFVLGAPRRHKLLSFVVFVAIVGMTRFVAWALPRTYHSETTLLAQHNTIIGALAIPSRNMPDGADAPTKLVSQSVLRRDNLIALVEKTQLAKNWSQYRSPLQQAKDWVMAKLGRVPSEEDKFEMLVGMLENCISVNLATDWGGEGTVTFAVDFPNAEMAFKLATSAQQNFLEARHVNEIDNISEAISILRARSESLRNDIDSTALLIEAARGETAPAAASAAAATARPEGSRRPRPQPQEPAAPAPDPATLAEAAKLKSNWEGKRAAIRDLEDIRRRRLIELQARLTEQRATYADSHPLIVDTRRNIEMQSQESPQVIQLRQEEEQLRAQYRQLTGMDPDAPTAGYSQLLPRVAALRSQGATATTRSVAAAAAPEEGDDRPMEFLKAQLRLQMQAYDRLMERIDTARMELDTAEAAFKYRYSVVRPASVPRVPSKPKVTLIHIAGFVAAIALALFAALIADLRRGRILRRWQVERMLSLPVVGEVHIKS